jgi:hypothetical protein
VICSASGDGDEVAEVRQDRIVEVEKALGPGDPDRHRGDGLGRGEDVATNVCHPMLFDRPPPVHGDVQTLNPERAFAHSPHRGLEFTD